MQYLRDEMLDCLRICNTSYTVWAIITCQALLRGPFPRQKWRYYLRGLQTSRICRFLFLTPSDINRRSLGPPGKKLWNASTPSRTPPRERREPSRVSFSDSLLSRRFCKYAKTHRSYCIFRYNRAYGLECFIFLDTELTQDQHQVLRMEEEEQH